MQLHAYILLLMVQEVMTNSSESNTPSLDSTQRLSTTITTTSTSTTTSDTKPWLRPGPDITSGPQAGPGEAGGEGRPSPAEPGWGSLATWAPRGTSHQARGQDRGRWPPGPTGAGTTLAGMVDKTGRPLPQEAEDNGADVSASARVTQRLVFSREDARPELFHNTVPQPQHRATTRPSPSPGTVAAETPTTFRTQRSGAVPAHTAWQTAPATTAVSGATAAHTGQPVPTGPTSAAMQAAPDGATVATHPTQRGSSGPSATPPPPPPPPISSTARPRGGPIAVTQSDASTEAERSDGGRQTSAQGGNPHRQPPTGGTLSARALNEPIESTLKDLSSTDTYGVTVAPSPSERPVWANQSSNTDSSQLDGSIETASSLPHYGPENSSVNVLPDVADESSETASTVGFEEKALHPTLSAEPLTTTTRTKTQHGTNFIEDTSREITTNTSTSERTLDSSISSVWTKTSSDPAPETPTPTSSQREALPPPSTTSPSLVLSSDVSMTTASDPSTKGDVFLGGAATATKTAAPAVTHAPSPAGSLPSTGETDVNRPTDVWTDGRTGATETRGQTVALDADIPNPTDQGVTASPWTRTTLAEPRRTTSKPASTLQHDPSPSSTDETSPSYKWAGDHVLDSTTALLSETLAGSDAAPGRAEGDFSVTSAPSQRSTPRSLPVTETSRVRAPEQPSSGALPDPRQEHHTAGTTSSSAPWLSWNITTTQLPPRFYIVPDQTAAFRVDSIELLLQIVVEQFDSNVTTDPEVDMAAWILPYLLKAPGFSKLLGVWSRGLVVQSLVEFETRGAAVWLGAGGPDSLLGCTGLAQAVVEGRRFRGSKVTNITVGGLRGPLCDWLLQCPDGFQCVSGPGGGNHSCSSVCNQDYCHHHGICTHHPGQLPVCRCLAGDHFWFMGRRCDVRMTRARLVGACLAILLVMLTLVVILALVAVRRYRAMLIRAKVNQTRSSYRRFNHFDELSGRFWLRSTAGSADSLDNRGFTRSDEILHLRALDRTCCYHDDTLSLASTCPSNGTHIHTVFPHSSHYGWRGSEASVGDGVVDSGKASDLSVCSWPVEPIHWTPFPLLQQLASQRPNTVRAARTARTRSYCEGMELVDMGKSWTA